MTRPSSSLVAPLIQKYRALEATRAKIESLYLAGHIVRRDVDRVYEGLLLGAHVTFEAFLEDLFVGLLVHGSGLCSSRNDIVPRVIVRTHQLARDLLIHTSTRKYIDWLPYRNTINLAKIFFRGGRPFSDLAQPYKDQIFRFHIVRNTIAHSSRYSNKKFEEEIIGINPLPPIERRPPGYLRGLFRHRPAQTRFENITAEILRAARELAR